MTSGKNCGLIFFLKYPQKEKIKTRLAKVIGDSFTLELYRCFILDMLEKLKNLPYPLHLFIAPPEKVPAMRQWLGKGLPISFHPQEGGDLGERMKNAFEKMFQLGYNSCIIMGSDFPDLPLSVPIEAFEKLKTFGAVIAPTLDGGYYLLGFQRDHFCRTVFQNVEWSTDRVFQQTMNIFKQTNARVKTLRKWRDVDDLDDLEDLLERNIKGNSEFKESHTMRFLIKHKGKIFRILSREEKTGENEGI